MAKNFIGIDLSKARLDIHDPQTGKDSCCPNARTGLRRFVRGLGPDDIPVFEATSGCDRLLIEELTLGKRRFVRVNPLHAWHYAQSLNLPKTDRVDARMLARFGTERQPAPTPLRDPARDELAELTGRRDHLKRMETEEKNRLARTANPIAARDIRASIKTLAQRIARFDAEIRACIAHNPKLSETARLITSVPGIGPVVAAGLMAWMPELGTLDRRAVASLGGLAPKARESGMYKGHRRLGQGRCHVRRMLYMAALSLWRNPGVVGDMVPRMRERGKPNKVILIALARKILTFANAVLRDRKPFQSNA